MPNLLNFNGSTKAHFIVTDEDIRGSQLHCENYAESHPILRVLQPFLYEFVPRTEWNGISIDTDDGQLDNVRFSSDVENWLAAAYKGKASGPVQFAIVRWSWSYFTIEIDWTETFVCEHYPSAFWEDVYELAVDIGIPVNDVYWLLDNAQRHRIQLRAAGEDYPDENPVSYDYAVYRTTR